MADTGIIIGGGVAILVLWAIRSVWRSSRGRSAEAANVALHRERLRELTRGLQAVFQSADAIVQAPKSRDVSTAELQDMARLLRTQVSMMILDLQRYRCGLRHWRFGRLLEIPTHAAIHGNHATDPDA